MKQLLDLICTGVRLGGVDYLLSSPALMISVILHLSVSYSQAHT